VGVGVTVPVTDKAYARGEEAPEDLLCVEYVVYPADSEEGDRRAGFLAHACGSGWISDVGAPNVDAGRERLEAEGWQVTDWAAA
jgi:hypothetical protein